MSDASAPPSSSAEAGSQAAGATSAPGDEALDAIVCDVAAAIVASRPRPDDYSHDYPYGPPQPTAAEGTAPLPDALRWASNSSIWLIQTAENFFRALQQPPDFVVPKTFGMSAILGIMTALALVFAALRRLDAEPIYYFFFSVLAITICLAQMLYGKAPRLASIIAGAIILPLFATFAAFFRLEADGGLLCLSVVLAPFGALLGYLTGTCAAGIFLVMNYLETYLQRQNMPSRAGRDRTCSRT